MGAGGSAVAAVYYLAAAYTEGTGAGSPITDADVAPSDP